MGSERPSDAGTAASGTPTSRGLPGASPVSSEPGAAAVEAYRARLDGDRLRAQAAAQCRRAAALHARAADAVRVGQEAQAARAAAWLRRYGHAIDGSVVVLHCAWCGQLHAVGADSWRDVPVRSDRARPGVPVLMSHGICPACAAKYFPEPGGRGERR
jgi:hypothetical protein